VQPQQPEGLRDFDPVYVRLGLGADITRLLGYVRSPSKRTKRSDVGMSA
jgi:hypothetical protein